MMRLDMLRGIYRSLSKLSFLKSPKYSNIFKLICNGRPESVILETLFEWELPGELDRMKAVFDARSKSVSSSDSDDSEGGFSPSSQNAISSPSERYGFFAYLGALC